MWLTSRINYQTVGALDRRAVDVTDTDLIVIECQTISSAQILKINNAYLDNEIFSTELITDLKSVN